MTTPSAYPTMTSSFDAFAAPSAGQSPPPSSAAPYSNYQVQADPFAAAPTFPQTQTMPTQTAPQYSYAPVSPPVRPAPAPTHDMLLNTEFAQPSVIAPSPSQDDESLSISSVPEDVMRAQQAAFERFKKNAASTQQRARSVTPPRGAVVRYNPSQQRNVPVPRSRNPTGSDAVHPQKNSMKQQRKAKTVAGVGAGVVVGTLVAGPVGFVLGGPIGGYAANKLSKNGERRAQRHHEQKNFQQAATKSAAAQSGAFA
eukprot:CAMPEP_0119547672 /NCGR_PEP_ID=MMETSP1352-20130426/1732_1 /TAXON_ID=265584 /ORGANISM="Stauroneis constricta, Strain CCMP1120" /LENGTH=254 /DNA_ID=CAMNT_0007592659 /DNA_START=76 /DNA_END=840 /DNA_ORIENTATION=-